MRSSSRSSKSRDDQPRDRRGRFASSKSGFAARGLAALSAFRGSTVAKAASGAAAVGGAAYLASRIAKRRELGSGSEAGGGPKQLPPGPSAPKELRAKPRAKTMRAGGGVRLAPKELDTLIQTVDRGLAESRNHGFVARGYQQLRTAKALETKGMLRRQAHPEGASATEKRFPNFVPTDAAIDALKKAGHLSSDRALEWKNNWKKPGRDL
jgi:hypothetical protein